MTVTPCWTPTGGWPPSWARSTAHTGDTAPARAVARRSLRTALVVRQVLDALRLDALLAHLAADRLLLGLLLGGQAYPLHRDGLGLRHRPFRVEGDLVLGLADLRAGERVAAVLVGDGLPFHAHLFVAHGHGLLDLLGDHVLAQPGPAALAPLDADVHLLLGPRHGVVAPHARSALGGTGRSGHAGCARRTGHPRRTGRHAALTGLPGVVGQHVVPVDAVVVVQAVLLGRRQVAARVDIHLRGALDLVLPVRNLEVVLDQGGVVDGNERLAG